MEQVVIELPRRGLVETVKDAMRRVSAAVHKLLAARAADGPYRFLVRRWDAISDIDLAIRVLGTEFFRIEAIPQPLDLGRVRTAMVIAPHQDDEAIGAGGTMLALKNRNTNMHVVYLTDGASHEPPYAASAAESARVRHAEAQAACEICNASMHCLELSNLQPAPLVADVDRLAALIATIRPSVIMLPWLLDSPAKHRMANHLLWLANVRKPLPDCEIWGYQVHNTLYGNAYVDITEYAEQKRSLLECFHSQNNHGMRYDHLAMAMSAWNSRFIQSTTPKYLEVFFTLPLKEHLALVQRHYFRDAAATYRGAADVLPAMKAIHASVTGKSLSG